MNGRDVVQRLRAFDAGAPQSRGETVHLAVAEPDDALVIAFVRMGGEARPWGIAFGHPGDEPSILTVPEGRDRDLVADMCAEFAPDVLDHLRTPGFTAEVPSGWEDLWPLRQIWLPNGSHLDMLHHLAYAFTFTRWRPELRDVLNALGRTCGWLFREAQRPGQQHVFVATEGLRESFTFPAQTIRQSHLGFLLAWLLTDADREERMRAAAEAERASMSASLDPQLERELEAPIEAWRAADRAGDRAGMDEASETIRLALEPELVRRYHLCVAAYETIAEDPRRINRGVDTLVDEGLKEQWYQHTRQELKIEAGADVDGPVFIPSPETDRSPAAAGSRYQVHLASAALRSSVLLHDDLELQADAIAAGDAVRGTIEAVWDESTGRGSTPVWRIRDPIGGPLRLRDRSWVCLVGMPNRTGVVRSFDDQPDGSRVLEVEIIGWKTKPDSACSQQHVGRAVTFVANSAHGIDRRKSQRIWAADGPGAWLTHQRPHGPRSRIAEEAAEDLDVTTTEVSDA